MKIQNKKLPKITLVHVFVLLTILYLLLVSGPLNQPIFGDEIPLIENLLRFYRDNTIIPTMYSYPTFYSYFISLLFGPFAFIKSIVTQLNLKEIGLLLEWPIYGTAGVTFELTFIRILSVIIGLFAIFSTYALGYVCCNKHIGLISAVLIMFTSTFIFRSTLALPDILTTLLTTIALTLGVFVLKQYPKKTSASIKLPKLMIGAALVSGVAVATKYNAAIVFLAICIISVIWRMSQDNQPNVVRKVIRDLMLLGVVFLIAFILSTPGLLFVPKAYWNGFIYESRHVMEGQLYIDWGEYPFLWIPMRLIQNENIIGLIFVLGALWVIIKGAFCLRILFIPVFIMVLATGLWNYTSIHYLLWCFPILAIGGGAIIYDFANKLSSTNHSMLIWMVLICIMPNLVFLTLDSFKWLERDSNLLTAEQWIETNIKSGEQISHNWYGLPSIWDNQTKNRYLNKLSSITDASLQMRNSIRDKPTYKGYLGYQRSPPSASQLQNERPKWVLVNSELVPSTLAPLIGYGSKDLVSLHKQLADYYEFLWFGGEYKLTKEFAEGPGSTIRIYQRVNSKG